MNSPDIQKAAGSEQKGRRIKLAAIGVLAFVSVLIIVANYDPGRLVVLQRVRSVVALFVVIAAAPLLLSSALAVGGWLGKARAWWGIGAAISAFFTILVLIVGPIAAILVNQSRDQHASVIAVAPDRAFEVVLATRHGDSGDYLILRARSRRGLLSRDAEYPFATLCGGPVEVTIGRNSTVTVRASGANVGVTSIDERTLAETEFINTCTGDEG